MQRQRIIHTEVTGNELVAHHQMLVLQQLGMWGILKVGLTSGFFL